MGAQPWCWGIRAWLSPGMLCSLEAVAEQTSSRVMMCFYLSLFLTTLSFLGSAFPNPVPEDTPSCKYLKTKKEMSQQLVGKF